MCSKQLNCVPFIGAPGVTLFVPFTIFLEKIRFCADIFVNQGAQGRHRGANIGIFPSYKNVRAKTANTTAKIRTELPNISTPHVEKIPFSVGRSYRMGT